MDERTPSDIPATVAARRCPRPQQVAPCATCGAPSGSRYGQCPTCTLAIDRIWHADWNTLLEAEGILPGSEDEQLLARVVFAEYDQHPWTAVDWAMTLIRCTSCGCELGGGPLDCTECHLAFGYALESENAGYRRGEVNRNDHAFHVGRWVIRHPHRYTVSAVNGWRLSMPILLTGAEPPSTALAQSLKRLAQEGRHEEALHLWQEEERRLGPQPFQYRSPRA